jgi:hypothetical protein
MPIDRAVAPKAGPSIRSRSRSRNRGARSQGNASRTCWRVQAELGWSVTVTGRIRRRSCERTTNTERRGRDHEEIHGSQLRHVILQEGPPPWRRGRVSPGQVLRHGRLRHIEAQLEPLAVDRWCAPEWIRLTHLPDQRAEVRRHRRPAGPPRSGFPAPKDGEAAAMPPDDRSRPDDLDRLSPVGPQCRAHHPEQPVCPAEPQALRGCPLQHGELVSEGQNFGLEFQARAETRAKSAQQGDENGDHPVREGYQARGANLNRTYRVYGRDRCACEASRGPRVPAGVTVRHALDASPPSRQAGPPSGSSRPAPGSDG